VFNAVAPLVGAPRLPAVGRPLAYASALHVCVPSHRADVLRALLLAHGNALRSEGVSFLSIGLDERDPLRRALDGLFPQPMRVDVLLSQPGRGAARAPMRTAVAGNVLHFETALV
jgi:hypothetical protein